MSSSEWETVTLGEVADVQTGPFGSQLHQKDYVSVGTPIITVEHLGENHLIHDDLPRVTDADKQRLSKYTLKEGDIVFSRVGSVDRRALVKKEEEGWLFSGRCLRVRPTSDKLNSKFLSYYFGLDNFKKYIRAIAVGSTMPSLNTTILSEIEIPFPSLSTQHRIADILSALDEKIELNRQTNATLESIAQSIFREWFLDNEDVVNWEVAPLSDIINLNHSRSLKKGSIAPYLDMANMPTQGHRAIEWRDRPFGSGTKFVNGDTLLARITPCLENGKTAFVDFLEDGQVGWGSTEYIVFSPKPPLPPEYGYYLARTEEVRNHAIQNMIGTSGRQRASASCFDSFMISVPPAELAAQFGEVARSLMAEIKANDEESRTLASIREVLLPKLMSGEIEV